MFVIKSLIQLYYVDVHINPLHFFLLITILCIHTYVHIITTFSLFPRIFFCIIFHTYHLFSLFISTVAVQIATV